MAGGLLAAHREYFFEIGGYGKFINEIEFEKLNCCFVILDEDMEVK